MALHDNPKKKHTQIAPTFNPGDKIMTTTEQPGRTGMVVGVTDEFSELGPFPASGTLDNGEIYQFSFRVFSSLGQDVYAMPELALYVDSIATNNLLLPFNPAGSNDMADWQIWGPFITAVETDAGSSSGSLIAGLPTEINPETSEAIAVLTVRNISAGSVNLYLKVGARYASNKP